MCPYILPKDSISKVMKICFLFLRYWVFSRFVSFLSTVSDVKDQNKKGIFINMFWNSKRLVTSSRLFLFFIILSIKGTGCKRKNGVTIPRVSFKITYFQKSLARTGCFKLFTKIKKGYGTSFQCRFTAYLFYKIFLIKYLFKWPSFNIWSVWPGLRRDN